MSERLATLGKTLERKANGAIGAVYDFGLHRVPGVMYRLGRVRGDEYTIRAAGAARQVSGWKNRENAMRAEFGIPKKA